MAYDITLIPNLPADARATTDMRQHQYRVVQINAVGTRPAFSADANSGRAFLLGNAPNSGQACELVSGGNVSKAYAGGTIDVGNWLTVNASAMVAVGSQGSALRIGCALEATTVINRPIAVLVD